MKKILPTLIAFGLFICVFAYYQYFQKSNDSDNHIFIWEEEQNKIVSIEILTANENINIKRNGSQWEIQSPIQYPANSFLINEILYRFSSPNANELVDENPKDLSVYGLLSPITGITITSDEGISNTVSLGNTAPFSKGYYVLDKQTKKVYTMNASIWDELSLDTNSLRDQSLLSFNEAYVNQIIIKNEALSFTMTAKEEDGKVQWTSEEQLLDESKVNSFIASLNGKTIEEFVEDAANDESLEKYGLQEPTTTIRIQLNDQEDSTMVIYVGNAEENTAYVTLDKKHIYQVESSALLPRDLDIRNFINSDQS